MIVATCSAKGSPGATTLAMLLGLVWPGERAVVELDPAGGDLPFRTRPLAGGEYLAAEPSVLALAADARAGRARATVMRHAQQTTLGVPVVPGAGSVDGWAPMARLWPALAAELSAWPGLAVCDLGRLGPGHPGAVVAGAAEVVLLVARPSLEGLYHLRERAVELAALVGDPGRDGIPAGVVVVCDRLRQKRAVEEAAAMLEAAGCPLPVAGILADDRRGAAELWAGEVTRRLDRSELVNSARHLVEDLHRRWPALTGTGTSDPADEQPADDPPADVQAGEGLPRVRAVSA